MKTTTEFNLTQKNANQDCTLFFALNLVSIHFSRHSHEIELCQNREKLSFFFHSIILQKFIRLVKSSLNSRMYRKFFTVLIIITCGQVCASIREFEELPNEILFHFEKSLPKNYDLDVQNALQALNVTLQRFNEFQSRNGGFESRDAVINSRIGIFLFTRYCGPGARFLNKIFKTDERTYAKIDNCCRMHDECPDYVLRSDDYKRYPGLDVRPQFFSRSVASVNWKIF